MAHSKDVSGSNGNRSLEHSSVQRRLERAQAQYKSLVERLPGVVYQADFGMSGRWTYVSPQIEALLGYSQEEWLADPELWFKCIHHADRSQEMLNEELSKSTGGSLDTEYRMITRDGREIWVRDEAVAVQDEAGEPMFLQGIITDITHRKQLEEQLRHQAFHDSLTGLANRALFTDRVEVALARRTVGRTTVAVLLLDLDDFKTVNDGLGHAAGDELLTAVAARLRLCLRPADTIARLGGDEFAVLVETADANGTRRVADRLLDTLSQPFLLHGREILVHASIGISYFSGDESSEELLRRADLAMYQAKSHDKNRYEVFDISMHSAVLERHEMKADLRTAVARKQFFVQYQPIVDLDSGTIMSVEALVRWEHPQHGTVQPSDFIHLAEETGLIVPLGKWVLETACRQVKRWHDQWPDQRPVVLNVNLSLCQLQDDRLVDDVLEILNATDFKPEHLVLEITESTLMTRTGEVVGILERLKTAGIRIALDDFGTGYSSLGYLQGFPVDILKISKLFVDAVGGGPEDSALAHAIIKLGSNLNLETVAEGIELKGQLNDLQKFGCKLGQGFYLARPLDSEGVSTLLGAGAMKPAIAEAGYLEAH